MQFHVLPANFILAKINMLPSELPLPLFDVFLGQNPSIHGLAMDGVGQKILIRQPNHFVTQILLSVVANVSAKAPHFVLKVFGINFANFQRHEY